MSIPIGIVKAGHLIDAPYSAVSLADAESKEPPGVYTVARVFNHDQVLLLDEHFDRLEQSAALDGFAVRLDRPTLRRALRTLVERSGYAESRFRITIPRQTPDEPVITVEPFAGVAREVIQHGIRAVTVHLERHNPASKSTDWITARKVATDRFAPGIFDGILVSPDGALLEGTHSNFYAIRAGVLHTAPDNTVLSGISRRIVLAVAPDILAVQLTAVLADDIPGLDEAFLTSASRGIMPLVEIDGLPVGGGQPGPYTHRLFEAYNAWAQAHFEPI